jgi:hypothetical protein
LRSIARQTGMVSPAMAAGVDSRLSEFSDKVAFSKP